LFFVKVEFLLKLVAQGGTSAEWDTAPTRFCSLIVGKIPNDEFGTSLMRSTTRIKRAERARHVPLMFLGAVAAFVLLFPPMVRRFGLYRITPLFVTLPVFFLVLTTAVVRDLAFTASKEPPMFVLGLVADEANAVVFDNHSDGFLGWIFCVSRG
jgi:hypothetical protein